MLMMCNDTAELRRRAKWTGTAGPGADSRATLLLKIRRYTPPDAIVPNDRLKG